ncbi:MAG: hypothetical protein M1153_02000 [Patescibacteria group bacterium]|nr:hypothetical protein [Patescibacteria group bacterium]
MKRSGAKQSSVSGKTHKSVGKIQNASRQRLLQKPVFYFAAKPNDALAAKALAVVAAAGYKTQLLSVGSGEVAICVTFVTASIRQRRIVGMSPCHCANSTDGGDPFVVRLCDETVAKKGSAADGDGLNGFTRSVLDAAKRYDRWRPDLGQVAPFAIRINALTAENQRRFFSWLDSVAERLRITRKTKTRL